MIAESQQAGGNSLVKLGAFQRRGHQFSLKLPNPLGQVDGKYMSPGARLIGADLRFAATGFTQSKRRIKRIKRNLRNWL